MPAPAMPAPQPSQPAYVGQAPAQPAPAGNAPTQKKKNWLVWVLVAALLLIILCCVLTLIYIDNNRLWCQLGGDFFNWIAPDSCP